MITFDSLDSTSKLLITKAEEALSNAYAPYSGFLVGAALQLENGVIITGTNQENAAYPSGMCAERVALFTKASLHSNVPIIKAAIIAKKKNTSSFVPVTPCGSCRQVFLEFELRQNKPIELLMQVKDNEWIKTNSMEALLPYSFTKANLAGDSQKQD